MSINTHIITIDDILIFCIRLYAILKKHIWYFILFIFLGGAIGFILASKSPVKYRARLTFILEDEKSSSSLSGALGLASQFGIDLGSGSGGIFSGNNIIELIKSRNIIEKTLLTKFSDSSTTSKYLVEYYLTNIIPKKNNIKNVRWDIEREKYSIYQDSLLNVIYESISKNNLKVSQLDKKTSIYQIETVFTDEILSKVFAEKLCETISDFYISIKIKKLTSNVNLLQKQVDSIRYELNSAIYGVAKAVDEIYNLNPAFNTRRVPSSTKQIDVQANTAILSQLVANLELAKMSLRKEMPLVQIIDMPHYPLKKEMIAKRIGVILGVFCSFFIWIFIIIGSKLYKFIILKINSSLKND